MTRNQIRDIILQRCGNWDDTDLDTLIVTEMDLFQTEILEGGPLRPRFLLSEEMYISTTIGERRIPLPSAPNPADFLEEWEYGSLWRYDSTADDPWIEIPKEDYDIALERYPGSGEPKFYDLTGDYFRLVPAPDAVYQLRMMCYLKQTLPSALADGDSSNAWMDNFPGWIIGGVGKVIAGQYIRDMETASFFQNMEAQAQARAQSLIVASEEINKSRRMGD